MRKGRFNRPVADVALRYSESVSFDQRLFRHDIAGSIAHAAALVEAKVITGEDFDKIEKGLREIEQEITAGQFHWDTQSEDLHMNIEAALTQRIGPAGAKLHTARSRNDQIALDLRLYIKAETVEILNWLRAVQTALANLAHQHVDLVMPAYTHLQRAQPIFFSHHLLAQIEAIERDATRLRDCQRRADVFPLGSGAVAGSTIVLNRESMAKRLGFAQVSQNSLDAVSDRDFVCEFLFCLALIGLHLSRLSEDLILWSTSEFGFIEFSDAFSSGSSLMPQKKNPDIAELTRGKTGRLYGNLVSILTTLKGLPSSYNRDLQEDKEALFDSVDTIRGALEVFAAMLPELKVNGTRMEAAAMDPNLFATDLAEYLVKKGMPFREAHEMVGQIVRRAAETNRTLDKMSLGDLQAISPLFDVDLTNVFDVRRSLAARQAIGAPSPENVAARIQHWRTRLSNP